MIKRLLQHFIVKTDLWPLAWAYRACYTLALKKIVDVLKIQPDVIALYLVAGMATLDYTAGLSDIDLIVIVKDSKDSKQNLRRCLAQLSRRIIFFKNDEQGVYTVEEVKRCYMQGDFFLKYKFFIEAKKQGRFLYGEDILQSFKALDTPQRNEFIVGQLSYIWSIFLKNFFVKNKTTDHLIQNYSCYKITSDICKAFISAKEGRDIFNRKEALEAAEPYFDARRQGHRRMIVDLAQQRFSGNSSRIVDDTYDFCTDTIRDAIGHLPLITECSEDRKACDCKNYDLASIDFILSDANKRTIDTFVELVKRDYSQYIASVLVSPPDLLHIEEQNIGIFITQKKNIPFSIIKELSAALAPQHCPQRLCLYAATPDVAMSLNGFNPSRIHSAIFSLQLMTPTLLYLSTLQAVRYGEPLRYQESKKIIMNYFWHDIREVIALDKAVIRELINDQQVVRASNIEFQLFFWQAIRLKLIEASVDAGAVFIPLSSAQVFRRCNDLDGIDPSLLEKFHDEYKKDLNGFPSDSEFYFSRALVLLKEIYCEDFSHYHYV